jgi:hypothetical protein
MASEIKVDTISEKTSAGGVTIDGLLIKDGGISGDVSLIGTTPTFTIGDAGAEDATLLFDGNAQDFHIGLDDTADDLVIGVGSALGTTTALAIDENANTTFSGTVTVGVDDTGKDVKLFGASAGSYALWDESANLLDLRGATAAGPGNLKLTTGELTVVDADVLGKIEFQAPLEASGTDAILVGASIWAEADDTFAAGVNNTDLVFALGKSEAAAEKFRFTADTEIGIAGANYGTDGQVLTSGGAGAACAWEDAGGAVTAVNNATANELVTIGSTTTELDAESGLTYTDGALVIGGTTPSLTIGDAGAEDTKIVFDGNAQDFHIGLDDSADDLVIGLGSTLGTTTHMAFDEAGHVTKPLQSAFCATMGSSQDNMAIDTDVTIEFATERFDQNADFNTGTYTFTAPVTGRYFFHWNLKLAAMDSDASYYQPKLVTSNQTYERWTFDGDLFGSDGRGQFDNTHFVDMDASDTAYVVYFQAGGTAQNDAMGAAGASIFDGFLVC